MLQKKGTIELSCNTAQIVRSLRLGDGDGDNVNDLILGGQLATDHIRQSGQPFHWDLQVRWCQDSFIQTVARDADLFERKDGIITLDATRRPVTSLGESEGTLEQMAVRHWFGAAVDQDPDGQFTRQPAWVKQTQADLSTEVPAGRSPPGRAGGSGRVEENAEAGLSIPRLLVQGKLMSG